MSRTVMILALAAAVLIGLVLLELTVSPALNPEAALGPAAVRPDAGTMRDTAGGAASAVTEILARPLFRGDRRPAPADARGVASGQPTDLPRLTGILMSSDERRAIFQPAGKDRAIVVVVGETVGNWRVQEIVADAVTLTGPEGTRRLETKFATGGSPNPPFQQPPPNMGLGGVGPGGVGTGGAGPNGALPGGPLFGVGTQQNSGMDRPRGKH
jgi:hypothetical protein